MKIACRFGAYSAMLSANGFTVKGFDISKGAVELTQHLLKDINSNLDQYIVSSITQIQFPDQSFDAAVAHAVIDHLTINDAFKAVDELCRIVNDGGLVYLSFDRMEEDDMNLEQTTLEDGSFLYSDPSRSGLLFRYYSDSDIYKLLRDKKIIYFHTRKNGEREVIIQR